VGQLTESKVVVFFQKYCLP